VNIERLLKEDYARTRAGDPARAGAYDRFLRRRARYARRVAAAASVALAVALALAVAVPRVVDRGDVVGPPKGQVLARPAFGYDLVVPPGWQVAGEGYRGLELHPVAPATSSPAAPTTATTNTLPPTTAPRVPGATTRRPAGTAGAPRPSSTIAVASVIVDPGDYPGLQPGEAAVRLPEGPQGNGGPGAHRLEGSRESGRRADGRAFVSTQSSPEFSGGETYYLAWPYYCAAGVRCPASLRYRALRVTGGVWSRDGSGLQALRDAMRRIVDTVRPVTNALPGGATADRPACQLSPPIDPSDPASLQRLDRLRPVEASPSVGVSSMTEGGPRGTSDFFMNFSSDLAMCHLEKRFTVEFFKSGRRVPVQGDETVVTLAGDLPEGDGEFPSLSKAWLWRNWCGHPNSSVTIRFRGLDGLTLDAANAMRPPCVDRAKPSTLKETTLPIKYP
jgi:hypothetical protein